MAGTTIPWQCWDAPGFKDCHSKEWTAARSLCLKAGSAAIQQIYGGDLDRCINEASVIKTLENCGSLCPEAEPKPGQIPLPADPTAIPQLQKGSLVDSGTLKILGAAAVAGILVWLVMRRKR